MLYLFYFTIFEKLVLLFCINFGVHQNNIDPRDDVFGYPHKFEDKPTLNKAEDRKEYNIGVLKHLQITFGHLAASQLQYYVPRGFWQQFR